MVDFIVNVSGRLDLKVRLRCSPIVGCSLCCSPTNQLSTLQTQCSRFLWIPKSMANPGPILLSTPAWGKLPHFSRFVGSSHHKPLTVRREVDYLRGTSLCYTYSRIALQLFLLDKVNCERKHFFGADYLKGTAHLLYLPVYNIIKRQ